MTDDEINERLIDLLFESDHVMCSQIGLHGYTYPSVTVGLIERFKMMIGPPVKGEELWDADPWIAGSVDAAACADTLARAVALAAIRYLEETK